MRVWKQENNLISSILVFISRWNLMLSWVEHDKIIRSMSGLGIHKYPAHGHCVFYGEELSCV